MDLNTIPKKTQLISLDSRVRTSGTVDNCQFVFGLESNVFMESMKDVICVRLIDYQIATLRGNVFAGGYLIDLQIEEIPKKAQILDAELGMVFARIPIDRDASINQVDDIARDQSARYSYDTPPRYFYPITLDRLTIKHTQLSGLNRERSPLQDDSGWMMILEITTIDHEAPKPDKLAIAIDKLSDHISKMPPPQLVMPAEPKKKIPLYTVVIPIVLVVGLVVYLTKNRPREAPPVFMNPPIRR